MSKKTFLDPIKVDDPCTEEWGEMTGNDIVRFCSHCSKNVNNISGMTRKEAMRLVRRSGGRLCVRYRVDPKTNSPIFAKRVTSAARYGFAAGVLGASILGAEVYAQGNAEPVQLVQIERTEKSGDAAAKILGYVTDPNGAAIPFALVQITNQETFVSYIQNASGEGFYEFKDLAAGKYKIRFEAGGFQFREIEDIYLSEASEMRRDGQLGLLQVAEAVEVKADEVEYSVMGGPMFSISGNELVQAVLDEEFDNVKARVIMRARINVRDKSRDGMSPLHAAVETGNAEIAEYLLSYGAKTNIRDYEKRTPLMAMDSDATPDLFDLLVRFGAKLNVLDKQKNNLLHYFAENDVSAELVRRVAAYGVDVNALNKEGRTPLMIAVDYGTPDVVRALIQGGADVNIRTREGRTAFDMAADADEETRAILQTYGAVTGMR